MFTGILFKGLVFLATQLHTIFKHLCCLNYTTYTLTHSHSHTHTRTLRHTISTAMSESAALRPATFNSMSRTPEPQWWFLFVSAFLQAFEASDQYMYRTVVTICTAQWSLYVPHSGHYMYRTVVIICTAQWSLYVPHIGHYMYRRVVTISTASCNIQQPYILPKHCICVFCVDLRTNSDYFPIQH